MAFVTKIKEYRAKLNMTQEDLAKSVGVRRETISHLEKVKYNPSLQLAHDIAKALHSTIDEIFIFEDKKNTVILSKKNDGISH
ncbi:transcriptional regulator [Bacillus thuringiensis serovar londrina]|nr:helix-turn-helix transcriptional regulator [Bacillus thuringiensis]OTX80434.1 transcriptional regulator [Bacillus thuringiensis serovar londrina]